MHADEMREARTPRERAMLRRYALELAVAVVAFLAIMLVPVDAIMPGSAPGWRLAWALLPVLPAVAIVAVVARYVRRIDELQRRVVLESLAVGFAAAMLTALTAALARSAGIPVGEVEWAVFIVGTLAFAIAVAARTWATAR